MTRWLYNLELPVLPDFSRKEITTPDSYFQADFIF